MRLNLLIGITNGIASVINSTIFHDPEATRKMIQDIKANGSEHDKILHYIEPYDKIRKPTVRDLEARAALALEAKEQAEHELAEALALEAKEQAERVTSKKNK